MPPFFSGPPERCDRGGHGVLAAPERVDQHLGGAYEACAS